MLSEYGKDALVIFNSSLYSILYGTVCSVLKFGSLLARGTNNGGVKTTLKNIGADVCHTNLAAFVKFK